MSTLAGIRDKPKLKAIRIDGIAPNVANIADGSYPLFTPLYLVTNPRSPKAAQAQAFVDFVQTDAGKAALRTRAGVAVCRRQRIACAGQSRRARILAQVGARPRSKPHSPRPAPPTPRARRWRPLRPRHWPRRWHWIGATPAARRRQLAEPPRPRRPRAGGHRGQPEPGSGFRCRPPTPAAGPATSYTVVKGDTLSGIAKKRWLQVSQLRAWNHLKNDSLQLGRVCA